MTPVVVVVAEVSWRSSPQIFMSGCLCFGGGVLLATVFLHLLPETRASFDHASALGYMPEMQYPYTELSVCLGFFFVYVVEEAVHYCLSMGQGHHHSHLENLHSHPNHNHKAGVHETQLDDPSLEKFLPETESSDGDKAAAAAGKDTKVATFRAVMVVVALSLHSVMEGLALGLMHTNKDVWVLFAALSAHKLIIAFCMGMELLTVGVTRPAFFTSLTIFSIASPLGGMVGTLVISYTTQTNAVGVLVPTVLHGLSAGTLLYVTFCEILERERSNSENQTVKLMGLLGGFLLMAVLQVIDVLYAPEDPMLSSHEESGAASLLLSTPYPILDLNPSPGPVTQPAF